MRIAMLTHKLEGQDGQGRVNYEIVMEALRRGHSVAVVAEFCSDDVAKHPNVMFVRTRTRSIPTQLLRNLHYAWRSACWLRRHRREYDVIQANGFVTWEPADVVAVHFVHSAWLKTAQFPFQWRSFSPYAYYQRVLTILNGYFERKAFRSAKVLLAVSKFTASELEQQGIAPGKIRVILNGVDLEEFHPGPSERASFGLRADVPLALFVGDIRTTRKNLGAVLVAMKSLPELRLAVAGKVEGSPYPPMVERLGLSDQVFFLGKTSRIPSLMRSTDFFVFPSRYEAHPLVLLEAMASGLPVVVSNNFGAADYVGGGGIVFSDADDIDALTLALRSMVASSSEREAMGAIAREQALGMGWDRTAAAYLSVYGEVVRKAL